MSGIPIKDPSSGRQARISRDFQLETQAETLSLQHFVSRNGGQAYQVTGDVTVNNNTTNVLTITNNSATLDMVITFIRVQLIGQAGGTALPAAQSYFTLNYGLSRASGGTQVTPINCNTGSGNLASATAYDNNPTMTGTAQELDRHYIDNDQKTFAKQGSLIIDAGDSITIRCTTDHTSGTAYARITFLMMDLD